MNTSRFAVGLGLAFALSASLAGCSTTGLFAGDPDAAIPAVGDWSATDPIPAPSADLVWDRLRLVLAGEGYRVDERKTHFDERKLVTEWSTYLAPNRFEGVRRRVHAEIVPGAGSTWVVRTAVLKQRNADIDNPSNPAMAKWESVSAEPNRSALLVWKVNSAFAPGATEE